MLYSSLRQTELFQWRWIDEDTERCPSVPYSVLWTNQKAITQQWKAQSEYVFTFCVASVTQLDIQAFAFKSSKLKDSR